MVQHLLHLLLLLSPYSVPPSWSARALVHHSLSHAFNWSKYTKDLSMRCQHLDVTSSQADSALGAEAVLTRYATPPTPISSVRGASRGHAPQTSAPPQRTPRRRSSTVPSARCWRPSRHTSIRGCLPVPPTLDPGGPTLSDA